MSELSGKFEKYIIVLEEFNQRIDKKLDAYDEVLLEKLSLGSKQLGRILDELEQYYDHIIVSKNQRKKIYTMIKPVDIFVETFKNSKDLGWFFNMANEADPEIFKELEKYTNTEKSIYLFKNTPFEDINSLESKQIFKSLKKAVKNREFRNIKFIHEDKVFKNLKCLKLVFMDNNWYIAYVNEDDILEFGRISFIQNVEYSKKVENFQPSKVQKHLSFIEKNMQNSMTLFNVKPKIALLKAHVDIAKYFKKDMKKFLSTQEFKEELHDGSVIFTLSYTQDIEILPLVQRWLPDIEILEPLSLRESFRQKLLRALDKNKV